MQSAIISAVLLGLLGGGFWLISDRLDDEYQKGFAAGEQAGRKSCVDEKEKLAAKLVARETEIRETQARQAKEIAHLSDRLHEEMTHGLNEKNDLIADLRDGNVRLRERFRTCANTLSREPSSAAGDHDPAPPVLSRTDQEFLVRIGSEADNVSRRLRGCQDYIRNIHDF